MHAAMHEGPRRRRWHDTCFMSTSLHPIIFNGREPIMIRKAIALACAVVALMLTACNTIEGAGKDIERGGEKIQGAAEKNK